MKQLNFVTIGEWAVLLPLWRSLIEIPGLQIVASAVTGLVWLMVAVLIVADLAART
jgi:hypothetical protein